MRLLSQTPFACMAAALGAALSASFSVPAGIVKTGDVPQYTWRTPLVNGMGVTSLEELHGKPVLLDFWGTR